MFSLHGLIPLWQSYSIGTNVIPFYRWGNWGNLLLMTNKRQKTRILNQLYQMGQICPHVKYEHFAEELKFCYLRAWCTSCSEKYRCVYNTQTIFKLWYNVLSSKMTPTIIYSWQCFVRILLHFRVIIMKHQLSLSHG